LGVNDEPVMSDSIPLALNQIPTNKTEEIRHNTIDAAAAGTPSMDRVLGADLSIPIKLARKSTHAPGAIRLLPMVTAGVVD
jgi:hypothetical protein